MIIARTFAYLTALVLLIGGRALPAIGQATAQHTDHSPRHAEWVKLSSEAGKTLEAYLVYPETSGPTASVVVIHENRGMTDWVKSVVDRLAAEGFVAIAPDLLSGKGPNSGGSASFATGDDLLKALSALTVEEIMQDLRAAVKYVRDLPSTNEKVAVAGFCWGGHKAFLLAAHEPLLTASFVFYGTSATEQYLESINCPIYGFYAENDNRVNATVPGAKAALEEIGKVFQGETYKGAGHGFMRAGTEPDATPENKAAMEAGWIRWLKLLKAM